MAFGHWVSVGQFRLIEAPRSDCIARSAQRDEPVELSVALDLSRQALLVALTVAAPVLAIGLAVGLAIAMLQAVTQLHEQTLSFVPKIAAMAVAAALFVPWIAMKLLEFAREMLGTPPC